MKAFLLIFLLTACTCSHAQYYYQDIVGTKQTSDLIRNYLSHKVRKVSVTSYDAYNTKIEDFFVEQVLHPDQRTLKTFTRLGNANGSVLTSFFDSEGKVVKTVDSSELSVSTVFYEYDAAGKLVSINSSSSDTSRSATETEEHRWEYTDGHISRMLRIKNGRDTTYVNIKSDEAGRIIEEQASRKGVKSEPVYYYYDNQNRLTDVVRYHNKAKRLLPEYLFEYSAGNQIIQKITVPQHGSDYLIWRYQYDDRGLKLKEAVFNKQKQLTGKIEYQYQFGT